MTENQKLGPGIREHNLHPSSGLRSEFLRYNMIQDLEFFANDAANLNVEDQTTFTTLNTRSTLSNRAYPGRINAPYPTVVVITFFDTTNAPAYGEVLRFRITGRDQFGDQQVELTPTITIADNGSTDTNGMRTMIICSKVFSVVYKIEFTGSGIGSGATGKSIFAGFAPFYTTAFSAADGWLAADANGGYQVHGVGANSTLLNWGIGLPMRIRPWQISGPATDLVSNKNGRWEILGGSLALGNTDTYPMPAALWAQKSRRFDTGVDFAVADLNGGYTIGHSVPGGWQGTSQKLGFITDGYKLVAPPGTSFPLLPIGEDETTFTSAAFDSTNTAVMELHVLTTIGSNYERLDEGYNEKAVYTTNRPINV